MIRSVPPDHENVRLASEAFIRAEVSDSLRRQRLAMRIRWAVVVISALIVLEVLSGAVSTLIAWVWSTL